MWEDGVRVGNGKPCELNTGKFFEDLNRLFDITHSRCNVTTCVENDYEATCSEELPIDRVYLHDRKEISCQ